MRDDKRVFSDADAHYIEQLEKSIITLTAERNEADRRDGVAERRKL